MTTIGASTMKEQKEDGNHANAASSPSSSKGNTRHRPLNEIMSLLLNNCLCATGTGMYQSGDTDSISGNAARKGSDTSSSERRPFSLSEGFWNLSRRADFLVSEAQSNQFVELHGLKFIGLGAVVDELSPRERVYDTLEQLTTRSERLVSIGYLVDALPNVMNGQSTPRGNGAELPGILPRMPPTSAMAEHFRDGPMKMDDDDEEEGGSKYMYDDTMSIASSTMQLPMARKTTECIPLDVWRQCHPSDIDSFSLSIKNLLGCLKNREYNAALSMLQKSFENQKAYPHSGNHRYLAGITAHNIAVIHILMGSDAESVIVPCLREAIALKEAAFGVNHHEVALSFDELGIQFFAMALYPEALSAFQRAHIIRSVSIEAQPHSSSKDFADTQGKDLTNLETSSPSAHQPPSSAASSGPSTPLHPGLAMVLNNMACCYFQMGDHHTALLNLEEASRVQQNVVARDGSNISADLDVLHVATVMGNCGYLHLALKHYEAASALFEDALLIQQSILGDFSHRAVRDTMSNLEFTNAFHS
jgi:tetratricopeptide (TPR) repeat protein